MKKKAMALACILIMCLAIASCSQKQTTTTEPLVSEEVAAEEEEKEDAEEVEQPSGNSAIADIDIPGLNGGEVFIDGIVVTKETAKDVLESSGFNRIKESKNPDAPMGYVDWENSDTGSTVRVVYSDCTDDITDGTPIEMHVYISPDKNNNAVIALSEDIIIGQSTIESISSVLGSDFGEVDYQESSCVVNDEPVILAFDEGGILVSIVYSIPN